MNWKRCTTLFFSLILLVPFEQWLHACGGEIDPYDYYPSFFQPSVTKSPAYLPFYYNSQVRYFDDWYDFTPEDALPDANIAEWKGYADGVAAADIDSFVYSYPWKSLSTLYGHIDAGKPLDLPAPVAANGMTQWFIRSKDREALGYLMYAKQCEPEVSGAGEWEAPKRDTARMSRLIRNGLQLHAAARSDFFRWRYAFQVLRLSLYAGRPKQTMELYTTLIGDKTGTGIMYPRCLGLKAGAYFRSGQKVRAAYLYSRVFDLSDEMKRSAFISFDWSVGKGAGQVLPLCNSNHEKAVVHIMDGLQEFDYALPKMQAAYELDPAVKGLDVVMVREINKVEARYQQEILLNERNLKSGFWYYDRYYGEYYEESKRQEQASKYGRYMEVLKSFARKMADEGKAARKPFWLLSSAYISFVQKRADECRDYLQKAKAAGMNDRESALQDLIATVNTIRSSKRLTAAVEAEILPTLEALDRRAAGSREAAKVYRDLTGTVLATAYLRDGDTTKAIYVLAQAGERTEQGFYVDASFMDLPGGLLERIAISKIPEVRAFYNKPGKTPYERWLTHGSPYTADMLTELEGTRYLRAHNFEQAVAVLGKVPQPLLEANTFPDAFRAQLDDLMEPGAQDSARLYNRYTFAKRMLALQGSIAKSNRAEDLFDYATGLYNMSYYGKAHNAYTYYRSSVDDLAYYESADRKKVPAAELDYYALRNAEQQFVRAAERATDRELKARALWMAGKCWQKRCPENFAATAAPGNADADGYYLYSLTSPYFYQLRTGFADTKLYDEVSTGCDYFRNYLSRR